MLSDIQKQEVEIYGRVLAGDESEIALARLSRTQYLKSKMRPSLASSIGDYGDNLADLTAAVVLGEAIRSGLVTDQTVIDKYSAYVKSMVTLYGGGESMVACLARSTEGLSSDLSGYYTAKEQVASAQSIEEILAIDLPGEPAG